MSLDDTARRLHARLEDLWLALAELLVVLAEDQPIETDGDGLAAADALLEAASELQAELVDTREGWTRLPVPALGDTIELLGQLRAVDHQFAGRFLSAQAVGHLRSSCRRRGGSWPTWRRSVEMSAARLRTAFESTDEAVIEHLRELEIDVTRTRRVTS